MLDKINYFIEIKRWLKILILLPTALVAVTNLAEVLAVNIEVSLVILDGDGRPAVPRMEGQVMKRKH